MYLYAALLYQLQGQGETELVLGRRDGRGGGVEGGMRG
jgi:hypothetical protein